jgi:dihydroorotase-like cyclic amidohydrolase
VKCTLQIGSDADFSIIDLDKEWTVGPSKLESKGKYSPLVGKTVKGKIEMTILRGEIVYRDDEGVIGEKGYGELVKSKVE